MKINLFQTQENDFKVLLNQFGSTIKVNNIDARAVITNTPIANGESDDKYISTTELLKRGDHIVYRGSDWYVINQITGKRYESFKAIARCAEHYIRFNLSKKAEKNTYSSYDIKEVPCIIQTSNEFGLDNGRQAILAEGELAIFAQDNATSRAIYDSFTNSNRKHDIVIDGMQYTYQGFNFIAKGIVRINVKAISRGSVEDGINWATSSNRSDWNGFIDKSFYTDEDDFTAAPVVPVEPVGPDESGGSGWGEW